MGFDSCIYLYNNYYQDIYNLRMFFLSPSLVSPPDSLVTGKHWSTFNYYRLLVFFRVSVKWNHKVQKYVIFCFWAFAWHNFFEINLCRLHMKVIFSLVVFHYTITCFIYSPVEHLFNSCSRFWLLWLKLLWTFVYKYLYGHIF